MAEIKYLAALKRHFENGGGSVLEEYWYHGSLSAHPALGVERYPETTQSNCVQFDDGSWLYYGKASNWKFQGDLAILDEGFCKLVYRLVD